MKQISTFLLLLVLCGCENDDNISTRNGSQTNTTGSPGQLKSEISTLEGSTAIRRTDYLYNVNNLLIQKNFYSNGVLGDSTVFEYDLQNRLKYVFNRKYSTMQLDTNKIFEYDSRGRLLSITRIEEDTISEVKTLLYNNSTFTGFISSNSNGTSWEKEVFVNASNNIIKETIVKVNGAKPSFTRESIYAYDAAQNPFQFVDDRYINLDRFLSSNNIESINYYLDGNLEETESVSFEYDSEGRLQKITRPQPGNSTVTTLLEYY